MIVSGTFMFFGIDNNQLAERLGYIATMFLTGQAFQVVATSETPSLGYLTLIDYFLVIGNVFIYLQFGFATLIRFLATPMEELDEVQVDKEENEEDDEEDVSDINPNPSDPINVICFIISSGLYLIFILTWFGYARFVSIPREFYKLNASDLNLASRDFVYILTYKDEEKNLKTSKSVRPSMMCVSENLADKLIVEIVGKRIEDSPPEYRVLSGKNLQSAIRARNNNQLPSFEQDPIWRMVNIDEKNAKKKVKKSDRMGRKKNKRQESPGPFESDLSEDNKETKI